MFSGQKKICLVIPCFNEANRLDLLKFCQRENGCYILFVDDGSNDNTLDIIKTGWQDNIFVLSLAKNRGKAEAVRAGFLYVQTLPFFENLEWVGYWDADLATPLYEAKNFILYATTFYPEANAIFGSRMFRLGSSIKRSFWRHLFGRIFATITSFTFKIGAYDSQCGAKLFKKNMLALGFNQPFISRWIFDVEILLRLKDKKIVEYPLQYWEDISGGSLKLSLRTVVKTISDIIKIKRIYR
ncbi:MAG: glycosyltransferase [Elusimicrobia bacterium]|nr:glycosyltransferase [Elusimicrobiota bacterium]